MLGCVVWFWFCRNPLEIALKVKLFSTAVRVLYKWISKSLCKCSAYNYSTSTFIHSLRSRHTILLFAHSPKTRHVILYLHTFPSFAYYVLYCFQAPNSFIKSYLSLKSQPKCYFHDILISNQKLFFSSPTANFFLPYFVGLCGNIIWGLTQQQFSSPSFLPATSHRGVGTTEYISAAFLTGKYGHVEQLWHVCRAFVGKLMLLYRSIKGRQLLSGAVCLFLISALDTDKMLRDVAATL